MAHLKPQDTLLVLKYWSLNQSNNDSSVSDIAESIGISASEVSKGTRRLISVNLAVARDDQIIVELASLLEWLSYGIRYAFPHKIIGYGRGRPTSWNCPILHTDVMPPTPAWVWPVSGGDTEGSLIQPFHGAVPYAASQDENLYRALSLLEVIRSAEPEELALARALLTQLITA